ncbi:MAG TPA: hypothetical protein VFG69_18200 [Nannocystaceae bacterium]|nr:hypothetical protein [Nannocystaceae bacterium]
MAAAPKKPRAPASDGLVPPRWARVQRIRLIRREVRESLSAGALDLLLADAELVVEGGGEVSSRQPPSSSGSTVFATVMLTIDLARVADRFREPADAATAERVAELMRVEPRVRDRLVALARPRLAALVGVGQEAVDISLEPHVRADGVHVLVDGDAVAGPRARAKPSDRR